MCVCVWGGGRDKMELLLRTVGLHPLMFSDQDEEEMTKLVP